MCVCVCVCVSVIHYAIITRSNCIFQEKFYLKKILGKEQALASVLQCEIPRSDGTMKNGFHVSHLCK